MSSAITVDFFFRWLHVIFGIAWIGLLYYFNFVQTEYFKEAEADAKADAVKKLAPRALWWFRWGAMFTFITGIVLLKEVGPASNAFIIMGAVAGTLMFLNVWLIIWPNQQVVIGLKEGDKVAAAGKAGLASRTNTLLSTPMIMGMLGSKHLYGGAGIVAVTNSGLTTGLIAALAILLLIELNALFGKTGPMTSVKGVIHCSFALSVVIWGVLQFL